MGGGGKKSCTNITLRDVGGNAIEVALWGDFSKQFMDFTTIGKNVGPTVIILTHAWCKPNAGLDVFYYPTNTYYFYFFVLPLNITTCFQTLVQYLDYQVYLMLGV